MERRQLDLFGEARPLAKDGPIGAPYSNSTTSLDAAIAIAPEVNRLQQKVYDFIRQRGGATCEEVEIALGMRHTNASPRIRELVKKKMLRDSGTTRPTTANRQAIVWVAVQ